MPILVGDANIFIDLEAGRLIARGHVAAEDAQNVFERIRERGKRLPWKVAARMPGSRR